MKQKLTEKSVMAVVLILILMVTLSACGSSTTQQGSSQSEDQPKVYHVGDLIYNGESDYYFGGVVYDSVVINQVKNPDWNNAYTIPLYVNVKKHVARLNDGKVAVQIVDVDRENDSVTLILSK